MAREYQQSMLEVSDDSLTSIDRLDEYGRITNGPTVTNPLNLYQQQAGGGGGQQGAGGMAGGSAGGSSTNTSNSNARQNLPNGTSSPTGNGNLFFISSLFCISESKTKSTLLNNF